MLKKLGFDKCVHHFFFLNNLYWWSYFSLIVEQSRTDSSFKCFVFGFSRTDVYWPHASYSKFMFRIRQPIELIPQTVSVFDLNRTFVTRTIITFSENASLNLHSSFERIYILTRWQRRNDGNCRTTMWAPLKTINTNGNYYDDDYYYNYYCQLLQL